jgi:hypothetical protein
MITYETSAPVDRGAKQGEALYYQIHARTAPPGPAVRSFSLEQLEQAKQLVERTQRRLNESGRTSASAGTTTDFSVAIPAGKSHTIDIQGPAAIRELAMKLEAEDLAQALRSTVLEIKFDGQTKVWCPVGALYGIGYEYRPHRTWYTEVQDDGLMKCYWVMPFGDSCRVTLHNLHSQEVVVKTAYADCSDWDWDDRSMHFHATWKQLTKVDTQKGKDMTGQGAFDVNYVTVEGQGVFVGDTLTVFNGANAWWGEGDEKIFVDNEQFPSHFGTGTEDYYGYAWCKPAFFHAPFHAQPCGDGNLTVGFTANSRYRALDAIPFHERIQFDMELWHWAGTKVNYAPSTFWYALGGAESNVQPDVETVKLPVARQRTDVVEVFRAAGALEGEALKIVEKSGGETSVQSVDHFDWSDGSQLWWIDGQPGDQLVLEFPVEQAGRYQVFANLTKAVDYGQVAIQIDDQPAGQFDRYHPRVEHDKLELGTFELQPGKHRLTVTIKGAHQDAIRRYMFGLDYLQLIPAS